MYKVLIIAYTELNSDPRPLKQIKILKEKFEVTSIGLKASNEEQKFYKLNKRSILKEALDLRYLFTKNYEKYFWTDERIEIVNQLKGCRFDCIIAHNELAIPLALKIDHNAKIILDAHEYFPEEESGTPLGRINKKFREYIMKTYSKIPSVTISVSENISKRYLEKWGIKSIVVTNLPKFHNIKPTLVNPQKIKLVHHGIVTPTRKIEKMINVLKELGDNYELTFFLQSSRLNYFYFKKLKKMCRHINNIIFKDHVPFDEIISTLNNFDIGLYILPPTNENLKFALPNKFFDFIQSRLAIAIGPSTEMEKIVMKENIGIVAENFEPASMAKKIKSLTVEEIQNYKSNCDKIALKYSYEKYASELINMVNELVTVRV